jgi:hypothetical protein
MMINILIHREYIGVIKKTSRPVNSAPSEYMHSTYAMAANCTLTLFLRNGLTLYVSVNIQRCHKEI